MTPEERDKRLEPELKYADTVQQIEDLPAFNREQAYSDWQSGKKPLLDALMSNYVKPERQITPEQAKRAKTAAAISDSLSTIAQMFAHSQGARVRNPQGKTSMQTTNERLQAMQNKYEQDMLRYNSAYANAAMQDWQQMLQGAMYDNNQKREHILYQAQRAREDQLRKQKLQDAIDAENRASKRAKEQSAWEFEHIYKPKLALQDQYDSKSVARRQYGSGSRRGNTVAQLSPIYIKTSANDPYAQQDAFGNYVKPVYLSKEQISLYGNMAIKDKDFNQHIKSSGVSLGEFDDDGKWVKGNIDGNQMAHMYLQWLNDNKNKPEPYSYLSPEDLGVGVPELKQQKSYKSGTPVKRTTAPEWKIPKANLANPNKSAGQPRFNHSPY